jgi:hypothetical protein
MVMKPEMTNELRSMVRDVLREVMASRAQLPSSAAVETVRISNDHDLAIFVARVTDAATAEKVRSGKLRFTLGQTPVAARPVSPSEMLTGVITEQKIDKLIGSGTLVLGPDAVLTPLARDKARRLGLKIERRR